MGLDEAKFPLEYFLVGDGSRNITFDLEDIVSTIKARSSKDILDVGCGSGVIAYHLAVLGYDVTGLDISPDAISLATARGGRAQFLQRDFTEKVDDLGQFDLALSWNTSFGFGDGIEISANTTNFYNVLRPGGCLYMDLPNIFRIVGSYQSQEWQVLGDIAILERNEFCPLKSSTNKERITYRSGIPVGITKYQIRLFSPVEIEALLLGVGFAEVNFAGPGGEKFSVHSKRMRVLAVKGG